MVEEAVVVGDMVVEVVATEAEEEAMAARVVRRMEVVALEEVAEATGWGSWETTCAKFSGI